MIFDIQPLSHTVPDGLDKMANSILLKLCLTIQQHKQNYLPGCCRYHAAVANVKGVVLRVEAAREVTKHLPSAQSSAKEKVISCIFSNA